MHSKFNQRSTDGITLNKVMVSITAISISTTLGISTYEYNKNLDRTETNIERIEQLQKEVQEDIHGIGESLNDMVIQQKLDYATLMNMGAKVKHNETEIDKLREQVRFLNNRYRSRQHE